MNEDAKLLDSCQQFEALMFASMLKEMRNSVPDNGLIPRSNGEKIFQEALDGEYAASMSRTQSMGLATSLYSQLRQQGVHRHADVPTAPASAGVVIK